MRLKYEIKIHEEIVINFSLWKVKQANYGKSSSLKVSGHPLKEYKKKDSWRGRMECENIEKKGEKKKHKKIDNKNPDKIR